MTPPTFAQDLKMDKEDINGAEDLVSPFPPLPVDLSNEEIKETAYEVFLAAYGPVSGQKQLRSSSLPESTPPRRRRNFLSSIAFGCFKRSSSTSVLGTYSRVEPNSLRLSELEEMRIQMDVTEKNDARARRALAKQYKVAGNPGALHVPLKLLLNINSSDFSSLAEYERWQRRQLKVLEAGILSHPSCSTVNSEDVLHKIRQAFQGNAKMQLETGKFLETLQNFQDSCIAISGKAFGYPLNVHLYKMLLLSLFDSLEESTFAENCKLTMCLVKTTWSILGIEQALHSICFIWVVVRQFVLTGATEASLLKATETVLREVVMPLISGERFEYKELLESALTSILSWVEKGLLDYWNEFSSKSNEVMESLVHLAVLGSEILQKLRGGDELKSLSTGSRKLEKYVESSLQSIFLKICEQSKCSEKTSEVGKTPILALVALATSTEDIAFEEQQKFSPLFKLWLPHAVSVAARTLHTCYRMELKQFLSSGSMPTADVVKILQSAATLERTLMQMIMQEVAKANAGNVLEHQIVPFASDAQTAAILKNWLKQRIDQLHEWSARNIKQETWTMNARREQYASSAVELLRFVEETSDAFFKLPVSQDVELLQDVTLGLDTILNQYVHLILVGCGEKEDYIQNEVFSRCKDLSMSIFTKLNHSWKEKFESYVLPNARVCPELNHESLPYMSGPVNLRCLCIRINTLYQIFTEIEFLEKKIRYAWQELPPEPYKTVTPMLIAACVKFESTRASCQANIQKLCDIIAYKVVFGEMKGVFWDGLYWEGVPHARMGPALEQLNIHLEIIAETVTDRLRNQLVNHIMITCYDCFLQVLYKKSTLFSEYDVLKFKDDLNAFKDLFVSNGEGLPESLVEEAAEPLHRFLSSLPLKTKDPENIGKNIEASIAALMKSKSSTTGSKHQRSASSSTISYGFGHTCHVMASNLVMRTYSFGKR